MSDPPARKEGSLTVNDAAMMGAGMLCVSAAAMFYRAKRTTPFKWAYFLSWPVLGGAVISTFGPNRQDMEHVGGIRINLSRFQIIRCYKMYGSR